MLFWSQGGLEVNLGFVGVLGWFSFERLTQRYYRGGKA